MNQQKPASPSKSRNIVLLAALALVIAAAFYFINFGLPCQSDDGIPNVGSAVSQGDLLAPDFDLTLTSGETVKLSDYRGKVVLIDFWASWCGPCVQSMPELEDLCGQYPDELVVLAANASEGMADAKAFADSNSYSFPMGICDSNVMTTLYPSQYIPFRVLISADGRQLYSQTGNSAANSSALKQQVADAVEAAKEQ